MPWSFFVCFLFSFNLFILIYLFLAALGLCCCVQAFSSCSEQGLSFIAVHRRLIEVASLCCGARALGAQASVVMARRLSSCGTRALLLRSMWDLPGPGLEPVSPALAGGFLTTAPPGKPCHGVYRETRRLLEKLPETESINF